VHWVFVAKYRRRVFDAEAIDLLRGIFTDVCSDAHATRVQMDGEDDHVHVLVEYPPKVAVSSLVNSLKVFPVACCASSAPTSASAPGRACSGRPSYFASSCGGAPISIVRHYTEQQKTPN
jgi:putative transposase